MKVQQLETELWDAADQLHANFKLIAAEYSIPLLGLTILRHADNRLKAYLPEIEAAMDLIEADYKVLNGAHPRKFRAIVWPLLEHPERLAKFRSARAQSRDFFLSSLKSIQLDVSRIPLPDEIAA